MRRLPAQTRFKFTEEARDKIIAELPQESDAHSCLHWLERVAEAYAGFPDSPAERKKAWRRVEETARELAQQIRDVRWHEHSHQWIVLLLEDLAADAREQSYTYEMFVVGRSGRQRAREALYRGILDCWQCFGGELKVSRTTRGAKAGGPTVRFVTAVLTEILGEPQSPETVADIIKRWRRISRTPGSED